MFGTWSHWNKDLVNPLRLINNNVNKKVLNEFNHILKK